MTDHDWLTSYPDIVEFGGVLVSVGEFDAPENLQYYYEKPYKWRNEHDSWITAGKPTESTAMDWYQKLQEDES